ncbi:hypothetical protein HW114_00050 [Serratia symbiotica]|uniref:hypothetical protein n=1 Tax=Serratia symbiotica TaxID=138074 RepID=UPI00132AD038|nr:hypothetical protein [Serratia symbiotica]MBF1994036.1 hypothetical protein [Serratia symbiotica]QTP15673.1 hypothetical protein GPZ83_0007425 [Serratia symbiotica]
MMVENVGRKDHSHPIYTYINSNSQSDNTSNQITQESRLANDIISITQIHTDIVSSSLAPLNPTQGPGLANDMRSITHESSTSNEETTSASKPLHTVIQMTEDNESSTSNEKATSASKPLHTVIQMTEDNESSTSNEKATSASKPLHTVIQMTEDNDRDEQECWSAYIHRHGKNTGLALKRNIVSVGLPTAVREYVRRSVLPVLFDKLPQAAPVSLGAIALATPIALQLIGLARDIHAGTITQKSLSSRLTNIALALGTGTALVATGGLSVAVNSLIAAVFSYVPLRDLSQYFLQLQDNNQGGFRFEPTSKSAAAYMVNQMTVDQGMNMLVHTLTPIIGELAANMLGRALINIAGETVDELTNRGFHATSYNNPELNFDLRFRPGNERTLKTAYNQLFDTLAGRATLFSSSTAGCFAAQKGDFRDSMVVGTILAIGYIPFIYTHDKKELIKLPATMV